MDGSPPLYYMLLSVWIDVFGDGPADTQSLSMFIALLAIPGGLWAGWSLFGRRAGLICAALCAVNPFLTNYAQETRMYSLMLLLSLLTSAAFLHVFAFRRPGPTCRRSWSSWRSSCTPTTGGSSWRWARSSRSSPCWYVSERPARARARRPARPSAAWHCSTCRGSPRSSTRSSTPARRGSTRRTSGRPIQISKGLLGGGTPTVALLLAGGSGLAAILQRRVDDKERTAVVAGLLVPLATLAVAWLVSQVSPAWTTRYLGVILGPLLLVSAVGLARAGKLGLVALVIVLGIWAIPRTFGLTNKSNAADLRDASVPLLHKKDLVLSMQPEQGPLLAYHLERLGGAPDLTFANAMGKVKNDEVMDWTDGYDRMKAATPAKDLEPLLASLRDGGRVLIVHPVTTRVDDWDAPWTELVRRRSAQWGGALATDKRFKRVAVVPPFYRRATRIGVRGVIYEKTG